MKWFGNHHGAPVTATILATTTPVGASCVACAGEVFEGDAGFVLPSVELAPVGYRRGADVVYHRACFLRAVGPGPASSRGTRYGGPG